MCLPGTRCPRMFLGVVLVEGAAQAAPSVFGGSAVHDVMTSRRYGVMTLRNCARESRRWCRGGRVAFVTAPTTTHPAIADRPRVVDVIASNFLDTDDGRAIEFVDDDGALRQIRRSENSDEWEERWARLWRR
jgi:hypothetical protein